MARTHFILLDGSYFVFFRYHAMRQWWKRARRDDEPENLLEAQRYRDSFISNFSKKLTGLAKLVGHDKKTESIVGVLAEDCASGTCWRKSIWPGYKGTRKHDPVASEHFNLVREHDLFSHPAIRARLSYPGLEGDDCIALMVAEIKQKHPDARISIVSSDGDFKQLLSGDVQMVDLKGRAVGGPDQSLDARRELFCKVVAGDTSDNIPPVMPRCGRKTAEGYFDDPVRWETKMREHPDAAGAYARNRLLVDFRFIPEPLAAGFRRERLRAVA